MFTEYYCQTHRYNANGLMGEKSSSFMDYPGQTRNPLAFALLERLSMSGSGRTDWVPHLSGHGL